MTRAVFVCIEANCGRNYLYGGQYIDGNINLTSLQYYLRTDLTSRAINNVWSSYSIYVSYTNLDDPMYGNSTPACDAHTVGPQSTKFCGNGGVFYLYNLCTTNYMRGQWVPPYSDSTPQDEVLAQYPGQCMPFGLNNFESDGRLNITASVSSPTFRVPDQQRAHRTTLGSNRRLRTSLERHGFCLLNHLRRRSPDRLNGRPIQQHLVLRPALPSRPTPRRMVRPCLRPR